MIKSNKESIIGQRIQYTRIKRGLSPEVLAEKMEISVEDLLAIEEEKRFLSIQELMSICDILNVTSDSILFNKYNDIESEITKQYKLIAIKGLIISIFGVSLLPFLAVIMQFIDSFVGFSKGRGIYDNFNNYIWESPLIYILCTLVLYIFLCFIFLFLSRKKKH